MPLWFGTGADFNYVQRAAAIAAGNVVLSPDAADTSFGNLYLSDGKPGTECRHAAISANEQVQVDLQALLNGNFEGGFTSTVPNFWTKSGAGTTADDTVNMRNGAHAVKINAAGGTTYIFQAITAVPGEQWTIAVWAKVLTGTPIAKLFILNRQTGKWWSQAGGNWQTNRTVGAFSSSGSYTQISTTPTVEDALTCGNLPNVELEIQIEATIGTGGAQEIAFDDGEAFPSVNHGSVYGHNIDPLIVPTLESAPANGTNTGPGSFTVQATMNPKYRPNFYGQLSSPVAGRFWRLLNTGTNTTRSGAISYGEFVLAQLVLALRDFKAPLKISWAEVQQRNVGATGAQWVYSVSGGPIRTVVIGFDLGGGWPNAQTIQLRDRLFRLSRNGFYPIVTVVRDADPESCFYVRPADTIVYEAQHLNLTQINGLGLVEDALPTRVI